MIWNVGLTDNPDQAKALHGNPRDWRQTRFESEAEARAWARCFAGESTVSGAEAGWRFGFWYSTVRNSQRCLDKLSGDC